MGSSPATRGEGGFAGTGRIGRQSPWHALCVLRNRDQRRGRQTDLPVAGFVRDSIVSERSVTFDRNQIAAYAEASGDNNPIHLNDNFARSVGLPGVIAHGLLQMGILAVVAEEAAGGQPLRRLTCRFAGVVVPGDTITFTAQPAAPGKLDLRAVNQRGEAILTKAAAEYV
jgi:acyl dehydratase